MHKWVTNSRRVNTYHCFDSIELASVFHWQNSIICTFSYIVLVKVPNYAFISRPNGDNFFMTKRPDARQSKLRTYSITYSIMEMAMECNNMETEKTIELSRMTWYIASHSGINLGMGWTNERRRYIITSSCIGSFHTNHDPWNPWWPLLVLL